jgi:hypothetical protein
MAGVTVGDRDEPDPVAHGRPFRRNAAGAAVAVVGMRAERDDVQLLSARLGEVPGLRTRARRGDPQEGNRNRDAYPVHDAV